MSNTEEQETESVTPRVTPSQMESRTHNNYDDQDEEQTHRRKGRNSAIEEYRNRYLQKTEIAGRQLIYVSEELHAGLVAIVKVIGGKHSTLGGYVENILRSHLSEHKELLNSVHKNRYKAPVQW